MDTYSYYQTVNVAREQRRDRLHNAQVSEMLQQAGVDQRPWVTCALCRLLGHLGRQMVAWGRRLESYATAPTAGGASSPTKQQRSALGAGA